MFIFNPNTVDNYAMCSSLTHCSLETPKRVIGKQCIPRSDAADAASVRLGSPVFTKKFSHFSLGITESHTDVPKTEIGLFQYIVWGRLFYLEWVIFRCQCLSCLPRPLPLTSPLCFKLIYTIVCDVHGQ